MKFTWTPLLNADGDIGASAEPTDNLDQSSVVTGNEPDTESASVSDQGVQDLTQQASFAKRFREETTKIEQKYEPQRQAYTQAEQIAKAYGYANVDDYFAAVNEQLRQQQAEQEAERLGVDPETYNQFFAPVHNELNQTKQQLEQLKNAEFERNVQYEVSRLTSQFPDFQEHQEKVFQIAEELKLPPNRLEDAYRLATYDSRIANTKLETEQQVLANITGRDSKQVLSAGDKGQSTTLDPSTMTSKEIAEISARVQRGERITF